MARDAERVGKIIGQIGRKAQVLVDSRTGKNASAHDLRRAFGFRWSRRVMPPQLQELMRHASIETTMRYYVGQNAEATAQELWDAIGTQIENSTPQTPGNKGF
jgi:integrase